MIAIVGGAKVSTKLDLLENWSTKVDALVIGGAMANTFLHAQGIDVGKSLAEHDLADTARDILAKAEGARLRDRAAGRRGGGAGIRGQCAVARAVGVDAIAGRRDDPRHRPAVDRARQGSRSTTPQDPGLERPVRRVRDAAVRQRHRRGRAKHAAELTKAGKLVSVAGGGDTVAALNHAGVADEFTYVSTAGGAFLEWLEGKPLPGVEVLRAK